MSADLVSAGPAVDPFRELIVTQDDIVLDPALSGSGGPFHFGTLVRQMLPANATNMEVSQFIVAWFEEWASATIFNGETFSARPSARFPICRWVDASGGSNCKLPSTGLRMDIAPFKLIAIVNRMDLRGQACDSAGQGRFVFALLDQPTDKPWLAKPLQATLIFEYALPTMYLDGTKSTVYDWATAWHNLGKVNCTAGNCAIYKTQLVDLAKKFTMRDLDPTKPNGNALSQIRTNEIAFGPQWELREFRLSESNGVSALRQVPIAGTPQASFNASQPLGQFIIAHRADALNGMLSFPAEILAAVAPGDTHNRWFIDSKGKMVGLTDESVRFGFAKATCNGCHVTESQKIDSIGQGFHLSPFLKGQSKISGYLRSELFGKRKSIFRAILVNKTCSGGTVNAAMPKNGSVGLVGGVDYAPDGLLH